MAESDFLQIRFYDNDGNDTGQNATLIISKDIAPEDVYINDLIEINLSGKRLSGLIIAGTGVKEFEEN